MPLRAILSFVVAALFCVAVAAAMVAPGWMHQADAPPLPPHADACADPDPRPLPIRGEACWHLSEGTAWRVQSSFSALDALIVRLESTDCAAAERIAARIVAGLPHRFAEVLIYCYPHEAGTGAAVRRVQWTPSGGFAGEALEWSQR
jgi:hypothetical protein